MKFQGVTESFACSAAGNGSECSPDRARWVNGYWSDVCQAHMDIFESNLSRKNRDPWTGRRRNG